MAFFYYYIPENSQKVAKKSDKKIIFDHNYRPGNVKEQILF